MKILIPVDGSDYTKHMLAYIAANNELLGSGHEYHVFTVVAPIAPHAASYLDRSTLDDYYKDSADTVLQPVRAFAEQQGWTLKTSYAVGSAAQTIAELVEKEKPQLIVMGTHGHSALGTLILGSVTSGVLARCKTPVLLVR
jgi:nucleotide-binding universal stress UspA family protein